MINTEVDQRKRTMSFGPNAVYCHAKLPMAKLQLDVQMINTPQLALLPNQLNFEETI